MSAIKDLDYIILESMKDILRFDKNNGKILKKSFNYQFLIIRILLIKRMETIYVY